MEEQMQSNTALNIVPKQGPTILYKQQSPTDVELEKQKRFDCVYRKHCFETVLKDPNAKGFTCEGCTVYSNDQEIAQESQMLFKMPSTYTLQDVSINDILLDFEIEKKFFINLARSVDTLGLVLQPVILVDMGNGKYKVYAGKRRVLSAIQKGIETISAKVFPKNTPEPLLRIFSITENMNRSPNPADEADNIAVVMNFYGWTVEDAAKKLSVPVQHVRERLKLKQLIPEFFQMLKEGKLTVTMARQICPLPARIQKSLLKKNKLTLNDIRERAREHKLKDLMAAEELFVSPALQQQDPLDEIKVKLAAFIESSGETDTGPLKEAILLIERFQGGDK